MARSPTVGDPLPNADRAIIPQSKLTDYALNADHVKGKHLARVFKSALGFDRTTALLLRRAILAGILEVPITRVSGERYPTYVEARQPAEYAD